LKKIKNENGKSQNEFKSKFLNKKEINQDLDNVHKNEINENAAEKMKKIEKLIKKKHVLPGHISINVSTGHKSAGSSISSLFASRMGNKVFL
jgi:hypothetical protein